MRKILLFLVVFSSICQAKGKEEFPVIWTSEIKINSLAEIPSRMAEEKFDPVTYANANDKQAVAKSCNAYFKLTKEGYSPANNSEMALESVLKKNCDPLMTLKNGKAAKVSYIRDFNIQKEATSLPAAIIFPSLAESNEDSQDVKSKYNDVVIKKDTGKNSVTLTSKKANMKTNVSVLGWGDFDGKGQDDMLVFVANYALDGTYHYYSTYLLTRNSPNGAIVSQHL